MVTAPVSDKHPRRAGRIIANSHLGAFHHQSASPIFHCGLREIICTEWEVLVSGMDAQTQFKFCDTPVFVRFGQFVALRDAERIVLVHDRYYLPVGQEMRPVRIVWHGC